MSAEFDLIRWIRSRTLSAETVTVGPGDDCAVLVPPKRGLLVTTDILTEGTDFLVGEASVRAIGRKAMGVNFSDIAAMGGRATAAVIGIVLPKVGFGADQARELFLGAEELAREFGVAIVGGDTNSWDGGLVVSVTVFGEASEGGPLLRSGAKVGDAIFVTGPCGGSILGRHLEPRPRLREIEAILTRVKVNSCIDISDGLTADLQHILDASSCGAILDADAIPIHPDAVALAQQTGKTPLEHALTDGEDFELIFTTSAEDAGQLTDDPPAFRIGTCVERGLWLRDSAGISPLRPGGWVHGFADAE